MNLYEIFSIILTIAVAIGYINHRLVRMPPTIAIMVGSLLLSLLLIIIAQFGFADAEAHIAQILTKINFHDLLMNGMLSFLLFAGALSVDIGDLKSRQWEIGILATGSTLASAILVGGGIYFLLRWIGIDIPIVMCFLFGALISPTDPIAVLAIFKDLGAPKRLRISVAGESLFNDGVGIVIFLTIYQVAYIGGHPTFQSIATMFLQQAIGGVAYGALLGYIGYRLIKSIDDHKLEILITLMIATGGYTLAAVLNISGPLAMVVAGIFIGNRLRDAATSRESSDALNMFWELVDDVLNAVLFLLIGFELIILKITTTEIIAGLVTIPLVLLVRFITVSIPISVFKRFRTYSPHIIKILTWGGLRGGLAVALALSLPPSKARNLILAMTYAVVVFSIVIQGLTIKQMVKWIKP